MIIGFAGRLRSGKTELSRICENYGYTRLYFALPLKQLIANLIDRTVDEVNDLKNFKTEYSFGNDKISFLANEIGVDINTIRPLIENKIFTTTRELLQYIGTDIIRKLNQDWHVNKIREMIDINGNYVIDDVRFPNEKQMIESLNGVLFFVARPLLNNISNHESEISLKWQNFDNLIINDNNLEKLKFKWDSFMKNGFVNSLLNRAQLLNKVHTDLLVQQEFMNQTNQNFTMFDMLFINKCEFTYNPKYTMLTDNVKIENFNNCLFRVYYSNGDVDIVTNPLEIEDLKFIYHEEK